MAKAILLAIALATFQLTAHGDTPRNDNSSSSYSAGAKEDLSRLAGTMLDNTNRARMALKNGDAHMALADVNRAEADLQRVEARAHGSTMIPVYREFVSVSILSPVRAEQNARKQASTANRAAAQVGNSNAVVHEVAGDYTRVVVNTTVAKNSLATAKAALSKGESKTADAALADVQEGVEIQSDEADMPLSRARENLILARASARRGHYGEAQTALDAASKALSNYEAEAGSHVSAAKNLQQQIDAYAADLQQNHAGAVAKINAWWNTTSDWSPYGNTQLSAGRK